MSEDRRSQLSPSGDDELEPTELEEAEDTEAEDLDEGVEPEGEGAEDREDVGEAGEDDGEAAARPAQTARRVGKPNASQRFQALSNENRELRERINAIERDRGASQQQQFVERQRAQEEALEQQAQASMDPVVISRYYADRSRRETQAAIQETRFQLWNDNDRQNYEREIAANPRLQRFNDRVEELRRMAPSVSRLDLLDKAIGEAARRGMGAARTRQQRQADTTNARNTTRGQQSRGNVQGARQRQGGRDLENFEHMRGVPI